jgi:hypothetical protein
VWCCLIHHEGFFFLDSFENYLLIGCVHHANTHPDDQPVMNLPPVETILFKYMLSSVFIETIQSSRHASHSLQYKGSWLYAQCSSPWIPLSLSNQIMKENALASSMMFITHIHAVKCAFELQSRWSHSQSWWVHLSNIHSNATMQ